MLVFFLLFRFFLLFVIKYYRWLVVICIVEKVFSLVFLIIFYGKLLKNFVFYCIENVIII